MPKHKLFSPPLQKKSVLHGLPKYALSVRQPHAQLLVVESAKNPGMPIKWCENRTWSPPESLFGSRILIHASGTPPSTHDAAEVRKELTNHGHPSLRFQRSALIGTVRLLGVVHVPDSIGFYAPIKPEMDKAVALVKFYTGKTPHRTDGRYHFDHYPGTYWWIMSEPRLLKTPILCSGHLNLWRPADYID